MDKFLDKFGLYDIFSMLIPGIYFMTFLLYLCPCIVTANYELHNWIVPAPFLFFVFSYFSGIIFHEVWRIWEDIKGKLFKMDEVREKYLKEKGKIIRNELDMQLAKSIKNDVLRDNKLHGKGADGEQNKFVFNYCMNVLEIEGMAGKEEKMQVISEMSASLFWSNLALVLCYVISICTGNANIAFHKILILLFCIIVFYIRKNRYARYRVDNLMRTYYIFMKKRENEKS